jgi:murein DD-endopeptidase MepM/ murein hydrolase activator NlpD
LPEKVETELPSPMVTKSNTPDSQKKNNFLEDKNKPTIQKSEPVAITSIPSTIELSSPLAGIDLVDISEIVSNPFEYLGNGRDDGHHGTDFSFYRYKSFEKIENLPVQSMFQGTVSSVIVNRPPYGNQIIIETPFSELPPMIQTYLNSQLPKIDLPYFTKLNCPVLDQKIIFDETTEFSIYVLYAHLFATPEKAIYEPVKQNEIIGEVGNTGLSGNPHLHLEFRLGPSDFTFPEMAHYDNTATPEEIYNYCLWRVSGYFFQLNPIDFIQFYLQNR